MMNAGVYMKTESSTSMDVNSPLKSQQEVDKERYLTLRQKILKHREETNNTNTAQHDRIRQRMYNNNGRRQISSHNSQSSQAGFDYPSGYSKNYIIENTRSFQPEEQSKREEPKQIQFNPSVLSPSQQLAIQTIIQNSIFKTFVTGNPTITQLVFSIIEHVLAVKNTISSFNTYLEPILKINSSHQITQMLTNNLIEFWRITKEDKLALFKQSVFDKVIHLIQNPLQIPKELSILMIESKLKEDEFSESELEMKKVWGEYIESVFNYLVYVLSISQKETVFNVLQAVYDNKTFIMQN